MDFEKLTWYIIPYNMGDVEIAGADPNDVKRELEDERYIYQARAYVYLFDLSKRDDISGPIADEKGYYHYFLDPNKLHGYTWKEIQPIAIDILFEWFANDKKWISSESKYKVRK